MVWGGDQERVRLILLSRGLALPYAGLYEGKDLWPFSSALSSKVFFGEGAMSMNQEDKQCSKTPEVCLSQPPPPREDGYTISLPTQHCLTYGAGVQGL